MKIITSMGEGGRIITIGSVTGDRSGIPGAPVDSMTKAAVAALTPGMARDLGPCGITVNTVQPGPTVTDMNPDENIRAVLRPMLALGRIGERQRNCQPDRLPGEPGSEFRHRRSALTIDGGYLSRNVCRVSPFGALFNPASASNTRKPHAVPHRSFFRLAATASACRVHDRWDRRRCAWWR